MELPANLIEVNLEKFKRLARLRSKESGKAKSVNESEKTDEKPKKRVKKPAVWTQEQKVELLALNKKHAGNVGKIKQALPGKTKE